MNNTDYPVLVNINSMLWSGWMNGICTMVSYVRFGMVQIWTWTLRYVWYRHLLQEILAHIGQPKSVAFRAHCAMYCQLWERRKITYGNDHRHPQLPLSVRTMVSQARFSHTQFWTWRYVVQVLATKILSLIGWPKSGIHSLQGPLWYGRESEHMVESKAKPSFKRLWKTPSGHSLCPCPAWLHGDSFDP